MTQKSKSRNADFISIAREGNPPPSEPACQRQAEPSEPSEPGPLCGPIGDTTTLGPKGRRPLSEAMQSFYTTCGASRAPLFPLALLWYNGMV